MGATQGCHHSSNTSTNTHKNDRPSTIREDLPRSTFSTSNEAEDVPMQARANKRSGALKQGQKLHTRPTDRAGTRKTGARNSLPRLGAIISKGGKLGRCIKVKETRLIRRETLGSPSHTVQKGVMILRAPARDHRVLRRNP